MLHTRISSRTVYAIAIAFAAVAMIPLFVCSPLPLNDYQAHLARMYILSHISHSPALQQFYEVRWAVIPNLAMDLIVPPLTHFMSLHAAGNVMIAATLLLLAASVMLLHRELYGAVSVFPLAAFLLLYNRVFLWGFINYLFGLALAILAFTLWLRLRNYPVAIRSAGLLVLSAIVFICHLAAFGVLGITIACYELSVAYKSRIPLRNFLVLSLAWLVPLALSGSLILLGPTKGRAADTVWGSLRLHITGLLDIVNNYNLPLDVLTFALLCGCLIYALVRGLVVIKPAMYLALAALFLLQGALPFTLLGSAGAAKRLSVAFFFLLVASADFTRKSLQRERTFVAFIAALFLVRMSVVTWNWRKADVEYAAITRELRKLPNNAKVFPIVVQYTKPRLQNPPLKMIAAVLVWDREDYIPIFSEPGQQPLRSKIRIAPGFRNVVPDDWIIDNLNGQTTLSNPFAGFPFASYDYIAIIGRQAFPSERPDVLQSLDHDGMVELLRVDHTRLAAETNQAASRVSSTNLATETR